MIQVQPLKNPLTFNTAIPYVNLNQNKSRETSENASEYESSLNMDNINIGSNHQYKKKHSIEMSESAELFKFSFYSIFTSRKKFPKKYVILIHNDICINLNLRGINRNETRSIDLYFVNFAKHSRKILQFIKKNKKILFQRIPELKEIMN